MLWILSSFMIRWLLATTSLSLPFQLCSIVMMIKTSNGEFYLIKSNGSSYLVETQDSDTPAEVSLDNPESRSYKPKSQRNNPAPLMNALTSSLESTQDGGRTSGSKNKDDHKTDSMEETNPRMDELNLIDKEGRSTDDYEDVVREAIGKATRDKEKAQEEFDFDYSVNLSMVDSTAESMDKDKGNIRTERVSPPLSKEMIDAEMKDDRPTEANVDENGFDYADVDPAYADPQDGALDPGQAKDADPYETSIEMF